jgi:hypothetical protein
MPSTPDTFKVPFGLDGDGRLVAPAEADKVSRYACPSCAVSLILRRGPKRRANFAHKVSADCNGETVLHQIAKMLIRDALLADDVPILEHPCRHCRRTSEISLPKLAGAVVQLEARLPSGRIPDVLLRDAEGQPRFAVELLVTHAVDEAKAADLDLPWIELRAADVVENPRRWKSVRGKLKIDRCKRCRVEAEITAEILARFCRKWKITLVPPYSAKPASCWKCGEDVLYFSWGKGTPPEPRPYLVQWRYSETVEGNYWASTCPRCKALQGNFHEFEQTLEFYYSFIEAEAKKRLAASNVSKSPVSAKGQ